jgi:hypothetical protein
LHQEAGQRSQDGVSALSFFASNIGKIKIQFHILLAKRLNPK